MSEKVVRLSGAVLILAMTAGIALLSFSLYREKKERARISGLYDKALRVKPDTVIVIRDTTIYRTVLVKPTPLELPNTVGAKDSAVADHYYDETFSDSVVKIRWQSVGNIRWMRLKEITFPQKTVSILRIIRDTVFHCRGRIHVGVYSRIFIRDFSSFPGLEGGFQVSFADRGGITLGCMRDPFGNFYLSAGGFFYLF